MAKKQQRQVVNVSNDAEAVPEVIEWSDPPVIVRGQRRSKYQGIIDSLMENPGSWALVMEHANPASAKVFTNHGCEITTRADGNGRVNVWAMYPEDAEGDEEEVTEDEAEEADEASEEDEVEVTSRRTRKRPVKRQAAKV